MTINILKHFLLKKDMARNSLLIINSSIDKKVKLREDFDLLEEGKELHSL